MSEIDDIFASKGKAKAIPPPDPALTTPKKKKKAKKKPEPLPREIKDAPPPPKKRSLPETVVDPSTVPVAIKRPRPDSESSAPAKRAKKRQESKEEEQFKDSRGAGPRRTTEEGWKIYKEDELGLTAEGGDTPLCPFDCECCF